MSETYKFQTETRSKKSIGGRLAILATVAYIVTALFYNYTFTFCTGAFIPDDTMTIETCYHYSNIIPDGKQYVSDDYAAIKVFNRMH